MLYTTYSWDESVFGVGGGLGVRMRFTDFINYPKATINRNNVITELGSMKPHFQ